MNLASSRKLINSGDVFGQLTAVRIVGTRKGSPLWECRCTCGQLTTKFGFLLLHGKRTSCRSCASKAREEKRINAMIGKRYGELTVSAVARREENGTVVFECKCSCGESQLARSSQLCMKKRCRACAFIAMGRNKAGKLRISNEECRDSLIRGRINRYINGASERGYEWSLSVEGCIRLFSGDCYYCGRPPSNESAHGRRKIVFFYSGIDRLDNRKGYTKENVVSCCAVCNRQKSDMSARQFVEHAIRIAAKSRVAHADLVEVPSGQAY